MSIFKGSDDDIAGIREDYDPNDVEHNTYTIDSCASRATSTLYFNELADRPDADFCEICATQRDFNWPACWILVFLFIPVCICAWGGVTYVDQEAYAAAKLFFYSAFAAFGLGSYLSVHVVGNLSSCMSAVESYLKLRHSGVETSSRFGIGGSVFITGSVCFFLTDICFAYGYLQLNSAIEEVRRSKADKVAASDEHADGDSTAHNVL